MPFCSRRSYLLWLLVVLLVLCNFYYIFIIILVVQKKEIAIKGDKEKDLPLEVILPYSSNSNIKKKSRVNVPFGQYDLKVASEEVGQLILPQRFM